MKFRKFRQKGEIDLVDYVRDYLLNNENIELLVGCDSQNHGRKTTYAIVVAMYRPGKGAHVVYRKWSVEKERVNAVRLINEVWYSLEVAELLKEAGLPKVKFIDIDLNEDKRYFSNTVIRQACGMVEGMGYSVRTKGTGAVVTYAADLLVKM